MLNVVFFSIFLHFHFLLPIFSQPFLSFFLSFFPTPPPMPPKLSFIFIYFFSFIFILFFSFHFTVTSCFCEAELKFYIIIIRERNFVLFSFSLLLKIGKLVIVKLANVRFHCKYKLTMHIQNVENIYINLIEVHSSYVNGLNTDRRISILCIFLRRTTREKLGQILSYERTLMDMNDTRELRTGMIAVMR